ATEDFMERMKWSVDQHDEEENLSKSNIAMKYLLLTKFDVSKAVQLYRFHEILRQKEMLDRIPLNNPNLIREIESGNFFILVSIELFSLHIFRLTVKQLEIRSTK
ncbi:unnamed protein product, partial [Didymodactylos carnosus]